MNIQYTGKISDDGNWKEVIGEDGILFWLPIESNSVTNKYGVVTDKDGNVIYV
jgi:hypothetical protein